MLPSISLLKRNPAFSNLKRLLLDSLLLESFFSTRHFFIWKFRLLLLENDDLQILQTISSLAVLSGFAGFELMQPSPSCFRFKCIFKSAIRIQISPQNLHL